MILSSLTLHKRLTKHTHVCDIYVFDITSVDVAVHFIITCLTCRKTVLTLRREAIELINKANAIYSNSLSVAQKTEATFVAKS